eukprot:CAMPEP_0183751520 /NCGR_PEP_ID=MMETSP0739-20130205/1786_1 /TAXON_ID=385413 /ORGANISM="Thalassiosira miniscula, Strain CCMP1093" /LENGTH=316 /DNA_ID=CAMNT_0025987759 /DNA_START=289 /DNA_END=1239 /DNA_ORIENTATION=-
MNESTIAMDSIELGTSSGGDSRSISQSQSLKRKALAMEVTESSEESNNDVPRDECSASALHGESFVGAVATSIEPLKVCLDDDSSIEDDEDDMFDDDAFTFGDEDFEALMSHEAMKRTAASIKSQIPSCHGRLAAPATASIAAQSLHPPLHSSDSLISDKGASTDASSTLHGIDSTPSTAASSIAASLTTLTLTSHASCNSMSKKTRSKRRVSLHNDVVVVPIPHRTEYPTMVRERIWSSASELYQNATRNTIEFASEGFDWRNVADDSQMVQAPHGERIHPIHYMNIAGLGGNTVLCDKKSPSAPVSMDTAQVPS